MLRKFIISLSLISILLINSFCYAEENVTNVANTTNVTNNTIENTNTVNTTNTTNTTNTSTNTTNTATQNTTNSITNAVTQGPTTQNVATLPNAGFTKSNWRFVCYAIIVFAAYLLYRINRK